MKITRATKSYEAWLGKRITLLPADLDRKHAAMSEDVFPFLRATFYRWMQLWPETCADEDRAPKVLAVGDLHVENFGTWRDVEGRLAWGINDFDEVYDLPYTIDLVRLAASAHISIREARLKITAHEACSSILAGYKKALRLGGSPIILEHEHTWLRAMMTSNLRDPVQFWEKMDRLRTWRARVPRSALRAIQRMLPEKGLSCRIAHRIAGLGSLGRERFVAMALFEGGKIAREAKALAPSACVWAAGGKGPERIRYQEILDRSVRAIDPFVRLKGRWIVRRLAPYCSRVELISLPQERDESKLLHAMGFETGNVHLGTPGAIKSIQRDLNQRPPRWLHTAASKMVEAVTNDWKEWRAR